MTSIPVAICRFSDKNFKEEYPTLISTEIIASEGDVYLSV